MITVAKEGIAMMAGAGASDVTMRVTGSQTASVVAGMLTSWGTGHGLNGVDTRFNISGNSGRKSYRILNNLSADEVNAIFKDTMGYEPPYKPGTKVTEIELIENETYVRVYDKVNSRMQGGWVMKAEDIAGLTPEEIQNKFALPTTPKYICDVNLEAGTKLRVGEVNPLFGFEGGGQQYDLIINGKNVGTFTNERMIGQ